MKRLSTLAILLLSTVYLSFGQDKTIRDENAQKRDVSGFQSIHVEDGVDLYLSQDQTEAVAVSASKTEYRDKIQTIVKDGILYISYDESPVNFNWRSRRLRAYVSAKTLKALKASGGSDVYIPTAFNTTDLTMNLSGGSDFKGIINAENMEIKASGGSDVNVSGKAVNLKISANGGSDFDGYDMIAENVFVSASGGSDARVTATRELGVEASGGSDIDYKGNAVLKYKSANGGSSVSKRN